MLNTSLNPIVPLISVKFRVCTPLDLYFSSGIVLILFVFTKFYAKIKNKTILENPNQFNALLMTYKTI